MAKQDESWAALIGHAGAHLQNGIDRVCDWGFKQMKKAGDEQRSKSDKGNPYAVKAKKVGRGVLRFLGTLGDAYYERYEKLKGKR